MAASARCLVSTEGLTQAALQEGAAADQKLQRLRADLQQAGGRHEVCAAVVTRGEGLIFCLAATSESRHSLLPAGDCAQELLAAAQAVQQAAATAREAQWKAEGQVREADQQLAAVQRDREQQEGQLAAGKQQVR